MRHDEQNLHIAIAKYLRLMLPHDCFWTTIPAGGGGAKRGAFIKAMGYRAGTPDLMLVHNAQAFFLEVKNDTGRASPAQKDCAEDIFKAGGKVLIVRSIDDVQNALRHWSIPTRLNARFAA